MDKICLEFGTFEEFATGVLQSVAKRCLSSRDYNSAKSVKKKSHFNRRLLSVQIVIRAFENILHLFLSLKITV